MKRLFLTLFIAGAFAFAFLRIGSMLREQHQVRFGRPDQGDGPPWQQFRGPRRRFGQPRPPREMFPMTPEEEEKPEAKPKDPYSHLVLRFDKNGDNWLNTEERNAARQFLDKEITEGRGPKHHAPARVAAGEAKTTPQAAKLSLAEVKSLAGQGLYEPAVLRTLFLDFDSPDWERELADFYDTDIDVPARLTSDNQSLPDVGVHFRNASSVEAVGTGRKYEFNLSLDLIKPEQNLGSYRTLNLADSGGDPSCLRTVLYLQAARDFLPAPKANFVRLAINGENWGPYVNIQQFNKDFLRDWFSTPDGVRWKAPEHGKHPGNLAYVGEDPTDYKKAYDIKSKDKGKYWRSLVDLCRVLNQTPPEKLEKELAPLLDIDGALKFLALENALLNAEGYRVRGSDYDLYRDEVERFHLIPHATAAAFREPDDGANLAAGIELDPLQGADDAERPLLHRLLAVPALRAKYLGYVREVAEKWLDWKKIGPIAEQYQSLIAEEIKNDPRKPFSFEAFQRSLAEAPGQPAAQGLERSSSLKNFIERRQKFLLVRLAALTGETKVAAAR